MTDYTGEIELIYRAGAVSSVQAEIVYANDRFTYRPGVTARPILDADWFTDRGEMIGVYAYAEMTDGKPSRAVLLDRAQIEKIKAQSKSGNAADSPWQKWPESMWLKSGVRQLRKWVPSSAEYRLHAAPAPQADTGNPPAIENVPVNPVTGEVIEWSDDA